jgi:hypothetical protein
MRRKVPAIVCATVAIGLAAGAGAASAAPTSGRESLSGTIVTTGASGTRTVVSTTLLLSGVFNGRGRIVEVENRPGDPDTTSRDNIVFPQGTMHLRSTSGTPQTSVDAQTCAVTVRIRQTGHIEGGTGMFRRASGTMAGQVRVWGVAARGADGSCSQQAPMLLETDVLSARGRLTF